MCPFNTLNILVMILLPGLFNIYVDFEGTGERSKLVVNPLREHFNIIGADGVIASLKNLDKGVWEQIDGELDINQVSAITDLIDEHYSFRYKNQ